MAQEHGAERGRKRQRVQRRDHHRRRDRHRELPEQLARQAGNEGDRDEDREKHERDRDDRRGDLRHRELRRVRRRHLGILLHDALDVLDDHDRVVDHETDRHHHREQRDGVGREAERRHDREGADQADGHRDGRDDGRPDRAEEEEHHEDDEDERFGKCLQHLVHGVADETRAVVGNVVFEVVRETCLEVGEAAVDRGRGVERVRSRREIDRERNRGRVVEARLAVEVLRTELDMGHVADPEHRTVRVGPQHDVGELLGAGQTPGGLDVQLILLLIADRPRADATDRRDRALCADRVDDVRRREVEVVQPIDVEPDPHRVLLPGQQCGLADTGDAADLVDDVDRHEVRDEEHIVRLLRRVEVDEFEDRRRALLHRGALALHLRGQFGRRGLHPVQHVDRVDVGVGAEQERDGQVVGAVVAAERPHVDHLVDADDLRLDRLRDRALDHGRRRARIGRLHRDLRRHDVRELRDRNARQPDQARERDDDRDDDREARPVDEGGGDHRALPGPAIAATGGGADLARVRVRRLRGRAALRRIGGHRRGSGLAGRHLAAVADALEAIDDHRRAVRKAAEHGNVGAGLFAGVDVGAVRDIAAVDGEDVVALLVRQHRRLRDGDERDRLRRLDQRGDELPADQHAIARAARGAPVAHRVRDRRAKRDGVGRVGNRWRHVVELAGLVVNLAAAEPHLDVRGGETARLGVARLKGGACSACCGARVWS